MNQVVLIIIIKFLAMPTHGFCGGGFPIWRKDMPCHFQRLSSEVDPEKGDSTDSRRFNQILNNTHCYKKKNLIFNPSIGCLFLAKLAAE